MKRDKILKYQDEVIELRRYFHTYPEVSSHEFKTSEYLKKWVIDQGLEVVEVEGSTGFYTVLDSGKPGKVLGMRTDIDALPIQETARNLVMDRVCISKNEGAMHACGHDGHMASLLGTLHFLKDNKDLWNGSVVFIFEEGEEIAGGIEKMVAALSEVEMDAIYGLHLYAALETGKIAITPGPIMSGSSIVEMDVHGRGGHGARPDLAINPVFAGTTIINALSSAWVNQIDIRETVTLGITQFHAGSANNVIADDAFIGGTIRFFNPEQGETSLNIFKEVATQVAKSQNTTVTFRDTTRVALMPLINDEKLCVLAKESIEKVYPGSVVDNTIWYASETFASYDTLAPIIFLFVGIKNDEYGSGADHHNEYFDIDEKALEYSLGASVLFALEYLK